MPNKDKNNFKQKCLQFIFLCLFLTLLIYTPVFAGPFDGYLTQLNDTIKGLGGLVIGIGGVTFALGWHSDDAGERIRGIQFMLAGALIISLSNLFASGAAVSLDAVSGSLRSNIKKAAGIVMGVGGVIFALGWHSDNADQRIKGLQTMTAGGLAMAVAAVI